MMLSNSKMSPRSRSPSTSSSTHSSFSSPLVRRKERRKAHRHRHHHHHHRHHHRRRSRRDLSPIRSMSPPYRRPPSPPSPPPLDDEPTESTIIQHKHNGRPHTPSDDSSISSVRSISPRMRGYESRSSSSSREKRRLISNPVESRCIGVFGLDVNTTQQKLRDIFGNFGPIDSIKVIIDAQTGRSRGFCFIYYQNLEDAKAAKKECCGIEVDGRRIRVDYSITQRPHTPTPGVYKGRPTKFLRREFRPRAPHLPSTRKYTVRRRSPYTPPSPSPPTPSPPPRYSSRGHHHHHHHHHHHSSSSSATRHHKKHPRYEYSRSRSHSRSYSRSRSPRRRPVYY